jgi:glycerol-3-phosphate dehydrogenase (NAD(P)+)
LADQRGLDLPITAMVAALTSGKVSLPFAIQSLLSRPLKQE